MDFKKYAKIAHIIKMERIAKSERMIAEFLKAMGVDEAQITNKEAPKRKKRKK